ncbi:MAG TPA: GtrA family protein [Acidimicrobiales bacterium]|nr:GtrA family protein [Acidimicrobiales bacterium]
MERGRSLVKTDAFSRLWRYASVSVITTVLAQGLLYLFYRVIGIKSAAESNLFATAITTVPAYYLNRTWAWGKRGRSHLWREVVPFWTIAILSIVLSTAVVRVVAHATVHVHSRSLQTLAVQGASFLTYGVIWVGKFMLFNKVLFRPPAPVATPLAGEVDALGGAGGAPGAG